MPEPTVDNNTSVPPVDNRGRDHDKFHAGAHRDNHLPELLIETQDNPQPALTQ